MVFSRVLSLVTQPINMDDVNMNTPRNTQQPTDSTQQLYCNYSANHILPTIHWHSLFTQNQLTPQQTLALQTLYEVTVPLALTTLQRLHIDIFADHFKDSQGIQLFNKLRSLEPKLIEQLVQASKGMDEYVRHLIWSMLLRGGAVLVFKAWLGKVKTGEDELDLGYFHELADLLWLQTDPIVLAQQFNIDPHADYEHLFLFYKDQVLMDRFSNLPTAALFVELGLYDPALLSLNDEKVREYFIEYGLIQQSQVDDLLESLNPLFASTTHAQRKIVHFYH